MTLKVTRLQMSRCKVQGESCIHKWEEGALPTVPPPLELTAVDGGCPVLCSLLPLTDWGLAWPWGTWMRELQV